MCGIFGYVGKSQAADVLARGLRFLTYRGYDSAGIAVQNGATRVVKGVGSVEGLYCDDLVGTVGIAHTRWATHGGVTEENAHPFQMGGFTLVHNGIVENFRELKEELRKKGYAFRSETDSEVIVALLCEHRERGLLFALQATAARLRGSYAIAALSDCEPGKIACIRKKSPLVVGFGAGEFYLSSDVPALRNCTSCYVLSEGESALLTQKTVAFYRGKKAFLPEKIPVSGKESAAEKGNYPHFMRKEIEEIPLATERTLAALQPLHGSIKTLFSSVERVVLFGCGTAYHAAVYGKYLLERVCRLPSVAALASELRYENAVISKNTLYVALSQSGETADTLSTAELMKARGAPLLAVTNTPFSSLARLADVHMLTFAGVEIGVAATKSFTSQLVALAWLASALSGEEFGIKALPSACKSVLRTEELLCRAARECAAAKAVFFIGRDMDYALSLEGSLKLKEVSYLFSDGYAAGELKHGTLALIEEGTPVVALITQPHLREKTMNAVHEVACRGAKPWIITPYVALGEGAERVLPLPALHPVLAPVVAAIPLQLFAYHAAVLRGYDPDRPRNLAKSVTVE